MQLAVTTDNAMPPGPLPLALTGRKKNPVSEEGGREGTEG
jgi:hypothetical protein